MFSASFAVGSKLVARPQMLWRTISVTPWQAMPLDEFRDTTPRQQRMSERVGRSWSAKELRRKSFDDLHKLWLVLYKERNMLYTELQLSRRRQLRFPQPDRIKKVGKSMGAIKHVLGERKRERIKNFLAKREEEAKLKKQGLLPEAQSPPEEMATASEKET